MAACQNVGLAAPAAVPMVQDAAVASGNAGEFAAVPAWDCGGKTHPAGEYIGYTKRHPPLCDNNPLPRNCDANPASLAARMAFSNFEIRSAMRYGRNAIRSVF